ncbi:MAG: AEC family transporter, partial [Pseudomonadota bacterium]
MGAILEALLNPILPIFAVAAVGFAFGRIGLFQREMAGVLNSFVLLVALPALLFAFLVEAPFEQFEWPLVIGYFAASLAVYAVVFALMRLIFRLPVREALLLGMVACFTNHVFFVLHIAEILYGETARLAVLAIITFDAFVIFGGTFVVLDLMKGPKISPTSAILVLAKNPMLIALALGLAVGWGDLPIHPGFITYAEFTGGAAAPASMFALGLILSGVTLARFDWPALSATAAKLLLHPLLVVGLFMIFRTATLPTDIWYKALVFTAAGPAGAMPFALALQFGVDTSRIVRAIIYSTVISLITLA